MNEILAAIGESAVLIIRLQEENARLKEQLATTWQPVAMEIFSLDDGRELIIHEKGESFTLTNANGVALDIDLRGGAICREVQS